MIHLIFRHHNSIETGETTECYRNDNGTVYSVLMKGCKCPVPEEDIIEMGDREKLMKKYPEYYV